MVMAMSGHQARDRSTVERHLQKALQHVATGQRLVDKQRALLATLEEHGHATHIARKLLLQFENVQAMHFVDRDRLVDELARWPD